MIINILLIILLIVAIVYLVIGGILWLNNNYIVIKKNNDTDNWSRFNSTEEASVLSQDDIFSVLDKERTASSSPNIEIQQLPDVFSKRIQRR